MYFKPGAVFLESLKNTMVQYNTNLNILGSLRNSPHLRMASRAMVTKRSRSQTLEVFDRYFDLLDEKTKQQRKYDVSVSASCTYLLFTPTNEHKSRSL